jgi:2,4-dienoyl-CoA reductase-like NADH-dependent reductase (Old Yellow Enzyme family)
MGMDLFAPYRVGKMEMPNRFIRSATWDGSADPSGAVTGSSVAIYRRLSKGNIGLIVSGYSFVSLSGQAIGGQYGVYDDEMIAGLAQLVKVVHRGGSKIALQINHAGISAASCIDDAPAVSVIPYIIRKHHEMTGEEIESIINDFVAAAGRAVTAGFDAVQLHGAHGYLMSQFLSPVLNRRTDCWGGSLANRARFHLEIIRRTRKTLGPFYPLLIKFGVRDESARGLPLEDGIKVARWLVEAGVDAFEVSTGVASIRAAIPAAGPGEPEQVKFRERAVALKKAVTVPVALVCGIRNLSTAVDIVNSGDADLISMCRPFIREPELLKLWQRNGGPAACISCNLCHREIDQGRGLVCGHDYYLKGVASRG